LWLTCFWYNNNEKLDKEGEKSWNSMFKGVALIGISKDGIFIKIE